MIQDIIKLKKSGKIPYVVPAQQAIHLENFCDMPLLLKFTRPDTNETHEVKAEIDTLRERGDTTRTGVDKHNPRVEIVITKA